ncbi:MAG TPA: ImmA/IrrE family metallo-endopeptidase [Candidatus Acidoferrum sp.]|nr:ImmA/IrrE family metallo-endopeptidase [Candidatus Acidoferrum sp.]
MLSTIQTPEQILADLGIREPEDLEIEAIAEYCGATIRYKPLYGCEARIIGYHDRAIITINSNSSRSRQRFSGGHELGHWMRDRGQIAFKCDYENYVHGWWASNPETRANRFASDLLLPVGMFQPCARGLTVTFESVRKLTDAFKMSLTATAIRLVEHGGLPSMLVCNNPHKREWFVASPGVSGRLWPVARPEEGALAFSLLSNASENKGPTDVRCDHWINHPRAEHYWIKEDSLRLKEGTVLSLLWWEDEKQLLDLDEYEEQDGTRRSDGRPDWE